MSQLRVDGTTRSGRNDVRCASCRLTLFSPPWSPVGHCPHCHALLPVVGARADVEQSIRDQLYGASTGTVEVTRRNDRRQRARSLPATRKQR